MHSSTVAGSMPAAAERFLHHENSELHADSEGSQSWNFPTGVRAPAAITISSGLFIEFIGVHAPSLAADGTGSPASCGLGGRARMSRAGRVRGRGEPPKLARAGWEWGRGWRTRVTVT
jgi:hypothetical protein